MADTSKDSGKALVICGSLLTVVGVVMVCYGFADLLGDDDGRNRLGMIGLVIGVIGFFAATVGRLVGRN